MAPTIMRMLGLEMRPDFDGEPVAYTAEELYTSTKLEMVNVEFWNAGSPAPVGIGHNGYYNNTYKALRLVSGNYSLFYSSWCTGERELYDMQTDFVQMDNRLLSDAIGPGNSYYGRTESELVDRLDALLMVTKGCKQGSCRLPWKSIFPAGEVEDLEAEMDEQYDAFFQSQPKVSFSSCPAGHIVAEEGPQEILAFT